MKAEGMAKKLGYEHGNSEVFCYPTTRDDGTSIV